MSFIRKIPFISGLFQTSPPYHTGKVWENKVGLQLVRVIGRNFLHNLGSRRKVSEPYTQYAKILEAEGVVEIPQFLSQEDWAKVRGEYDAYKSKLVFEAYKPSGKVSMMAARLSLDKHPQDFPETIRIMRDNKILKEMAEMALKKDMSKYKPTLSYLVLHKDDNDEYDDDIENILHADVHYPTVKCFLYLGEATKANGAYIYAKGSHKLSASRLSYEYNMGVRVAKLKRGDKDIPAKYLDKRGSIVRNIMSEEQRKAMGVVETQFVGPGNTLIVTNNIGFHRRGEFEPNQTRETLLVNFRSVESSKLRKFLNK